ncbi:MAG TPA: transposase [Burkholderiales bacterium]|nr:transposase [Burkholderiales bacterium]
MAIHVIQRGNNRSACFVTDSDRLLYLLHLRELSKKFSCAVHAYCLMPNHVHLLLTPGDAQACAALMRELGQRYVQYFNRRYKRTGTLWEGRFRSCVTESASYVLACYRYIELNPVRACIVGRPDDYLWSSFRANSGERSESLVSPHPEYLALGTHTTARSAAYIGLFANPLEPSLLDGIRNATNGGYPLGSESFKSALLASLGQKVEPARPGRPRKEARKSGSDPDFVTTGV